MARALWKGSIAFGLVNIPVELHTAVRDSRPRFRMLHAEDKSPVKFERVCAREGTPVAWDELVKGYEYQKGRFVIVTKEDFRAAALEKNRTVDIRSFVKGDDIDDRFFEIVVLPDARPRVASAPTRCCAKPFARPGSSASPPSSCATRSTWPPSKWSKNAMVLTLMRYAEELVDVGESTFPTAPGHPQARADDGAHAGREARRHLGSDAVHRSSTAPT